MSGSHSNNDLKRENNLTSDLKKILEKDEKEIHAAMVDFLKNKPSVSATDVIEFLNDETVKLKMHFIGYRDKFDMIKSKPSGINDTGGPFPPDYFDDMPVVNQKAYWHKVNDEGTMHHKKQARMLMAFLYEHKPDLSKMDHLPILNLAIINNDLNIVRAIAPHASKKALADALQYVEEDTLWQIIKTLFDNRPDRTVINHPIVILYCCHHAKILLNFIDEFSLSLESLPKKAQTFIFRMFDASNLPCKVELEKELTTVKNMLSARPLTIDNFNTAGAQLIRAIERYSIQLVKSTRYKNALINFLPNSMIPTQNRNTKEDRLKAVNASTYLDEITSTMVHFTNNVDFSFLASKIKGPGLEAAQSKLAGGMSNGDSKQEIGGSTLSSGK